MKIGIIVAMGKELDLLLNILEQSSEITINDYTIHRGTVGDREVYAMQCGIGKVNAAIGTLTLIDTFHPDIIINSGVAGGTGHGAGILDLVLAERIAYHDVWCGPGTEWGQAADCPKYFECPVPAAEMAHKLNAKHGLIASGDIFVSRVEDVDRILGLYPEAIAVDMESGAIAQVCCIKQVPMICLRVVSDTPGKADNISQYKNFWGDAPHFTFVALRSLINLL